MIGAWRKSIVVGCFVTVVMFTVSLAAQADELIPIVRPSGSTPTWVTDLVVQEITGSPQSNTATLYNSSGTAIGTIPVSLPAKRVCLKGVQMLVIIDL